MSERHRILHADNLDALRSFEDASVDLIYIDPPFNTGKRQEKRTTRSVTDEAAGEHVGFHGRRYRSVELSSSGWEDRFDDFLAFLAPRLEEARRVLAEQGSFFLHIDYREVHYCKVLLDEIFGRKCFQNEIIWAYDYGARTKKRWPAKHDNILWYTKDPKSFCFDFEAMDRIPYMAPRLVSPEKAARGKTPTDVWWHTIVSPTGSEKTGYATQKPLGILERIIKVHSRVGDTVLDFFAGSGTTGEAAALHERRFVLVDSNPEAIEVMSRRLARFEPEVVGYDVAPNQAASSQENPS